ncbi:hypothetical protein BJX96DRAFT_161547 [Aspergillus floccosus]
MASIHSSSSANDPKEETTEPNLYSINENEQKSGILEPAEPSPRQLVFRRWVNSFRSKRNRPSCRPVKIVEGWSDGSQEGNRSSSNLAPESLLPEPEWRLSGQSSNLEAVKTTTMSITSRSMIMSGGTNRSTNHSVTSEFRESMDNSTPQRLSIDVEAHSRAINRCHVVRELITTEAEYVFGLKALTDVLYLFSSRTEIHYNIQSIRAVHERFLANVRKISPSISIDDKEIQQPPRAEGHDPNTTQISFKVLRYKSLRTRTFGSTVNRRPHPLTVGTEEASEIAVEIQKLSTSFKLYEQFYCNYDQLTEDLDMLRQLVPDWPVFNQGVEALSKAVASIETKALTENKAMSLNDMIIKSGFGGSSECGLSSQQRLRKPSHEDSYSKNHPPWKNDSPPKNETFIQCAVHDIYQQLGPMCLCGVLHVTYRLSGQIEGKYMVCVLFKSHLLLASADYDKAKLRGVACLYICDTKFDTLSNGRGLCCHGSLFSWKLSIQYQDDDFELVLSASSANDEKSWHTEILRSTSLTLDMPKPVAFELKGYTFLALDLTPLNSVHNPDASLLRTPSVHSATVPGLNSNLEHIIIKKTHCPNQFNQTSRVEEGEIERPKMHSSPARVLTSRRHDRIRLEKLIACMYTKECLNYPGMVLTRNEMLFGSGSLMRRLSLRPGHKRSNSSALPVAKTRADNGHGAQRSKLKKGDSPDGKGRDISERCPKDNHEMGHSQYEFTLGSSRRKRIPILGSRAASTPNLAALKIETKTDYRSEIPSPKMTLLSMFNSMSLRRPKRNIRRGLHSAG